MNYCQCSPTTGGQHATTCPLYQVTGVAILDSNPPPPAPKGWLCPRCGASNSPKMAQCACEGPPPGQQVLLG